MEQDKVYHNWSIVYAAKIVKILNFLIFNHIFSCCNINSLQKSSAIQ